MPAKINDWLYGGVSIASCESKNEVLVTHCWHNLTIGIDVVFVLLVIKVVLVLRVIEFLIKLITGGVVGFVSTVARH